MFLIMKINKKFYHGTTVESFAKIIESKELKHMGGSCATDDFHYAKVYAMQMQGVGIVLMFRIETEMNLKGWLQYWVNRNLIRKLIGWNSYLSELYIEKFENYCWGFVEDSMEFYIDDTPIKKIEKIWIVGSLLNVV